MLDQAAHQAASLLYTALISVGALAAFIGGARTHAYKRRRRAQKRLQQKWGKPRPASSLRVPGRRLAVVSTAAIPWMTGTAVNPTLRAAYMAHCTDLKVILVVPWLARSDQALIFPNQRTFERPAEQEACMREWIKKRTGLSPDFEIVWYPGRYDRTMLGIFPVGDLTEIVEADARADAVILEEPEHLTWFHHGPRWTDRFGHVVGIIHTSYRELSKRNAGLVMAGVSSLLNSWLCAIHCHKVIKLSDAVQSLPREVTCCVHGAAPGFVTAGAGKTHAPEGGGRRFSKGAYCLAKVVWGKGWEELLELLEYQGRIARARGEAPAHVDAFGDGEALASVQGKARAAGLALAFHAKRDHLDPSLADYQVFINASTSDVVATTSVEALAMGKWLICARHACNDWAASFSNALVYRTPNEFVAHLTRALAHEPPPLPEEELRRLGWEAATERCLDAASIGEHEWPTRLSGAQEALLWGTYNTFTGLEPVRLAVCAGANTLHAPETLTAYDPNPNPGGSWLDALRPRLQLSLGSSALRFFWASTGDCTDDWRAERRPIQAAAKRS
ncbi:hypothetical protein WJX81_002889 [Elliptochloris bilobata]|uniref:Digalactosyldiacylglycerol synthase n=1 Tax=Elliptochloris bilobata TaxID=381761 RepID=A0AAW1SIB1_9CHLO